MLNLRIYIKHAVLLLWDKILLKEYNCRFLCNNIPNITKFWSFFKKLSFCMFYVVWKYDECYLFDSEVITGSFMWAQMSWKSRVWYRIYNFYDPIILSPLDPRFTGKLWPRFAFKLILFVLFYLYILTGIMYLLTTLVRFSPCCLDKTLFLYPVALNRNLGLNSWISRFGSYVSPRANNYWQHEIR
jgi:hypothetical protein